MSRNNPLLHSRFTPCLTAATLTLLMVRTGFAQEVTSSTTDPGTPKMLDTIQVSGSWLGTGLQDSVKTFAGARSVIKKETIEDTGATSIGDVMRRIPGVQSTDNSGTAGSAISMNIGVRGLTGRYSPRSTVLIDGVPAAFAPYGQPQLSMAPISSGNLDSIDVVRGAGSVRYGPQNVGGIINFTTRAIPKTFAAEASIGTEIYSHGGNVKTTPSFFVGGTNESGLGLAVLYSGTHGKGWRSSNDKTDIDDLLRESRDGLERVKKIVADLKDFSRVDQAQWQDADLNAGIECTLNVVWNELKYKAEVVRAYDPSLPRVPCLPAQINQVVMNLLVNAAQAIAERGVITLRTGHDAGWAWIEVEDSGGGMPPEVLKHIFDPFYTTKPVGKGTGLGLSISYDIVRKHGGRIEVASTLGQGSRFRVWLPVRINSRGE